MTHKHGWRAAVVVGSCGPETGRGWGVAPEGSGMRSVTPTLRAISRTPHSTARAWGPVSGRLRGPWRQGYAKARHWPGALVEHRGTFGVVGDCVNAGTAEGTGTYRGRCADAA